MSFTDICRLTTIVLLCVAMVAAQRLWQRHPVFEPWLIFSIGALCCMVLGKIIAIAREHQLLSPHYAVFDECLLPILGGVAWAMSFLWSRNRLWALTVIESELRSVREHANRDELLCPSQKRMAVEEAKHGAATG